MKTKVVAGILVLAVVAAAIGVVAARNNFGMQQPPTMGQQWSGGSRWMNQLTEEERQVVHQKIQEFREGQRQEAQEFKQQICGQYNITCPSGTEFVDEDGDGINDNMSPHGWRYWRGPGFNGSAQNPNPDE